MIKRFTDRLTAQTDPILKAVTLMVLIGSILTGIGLLALGLTWYTHGYLPTFLVLSVVAIVYVVGVSTVITLVIYKMAGWIIEATEGQITVEVEDND